MFKFSWILPILGGKKTEFTLTPMGFSLRKISKMRHGRSGKLVLGRSVL